LTYQSLAKRSRKVRKINVYSTTQDTFYCDALLIKVLSRKNEVKPEKTAVAERKMELLLSSQETSRASRPMQRRFMT